MYTKNLLTAANSITLELLELVTPCNLLVGIMALFSINGLGLSKHYCIENPEM